MNMEKNKAEISEYEITVKGTLPQRFSSWLNNMRIHHCTNCESKIRGKIEDQSALFGILIKIRDLGLPLISLKKCEENDMNFNDLNNNESK